MQSLLLRTALVSIVGTAMLGALMLQTQARPALAEEPQPRVINVNGQGQVQRAPDMAMVWLGVETTEPTAQAAMERNGALMSAVIEHIKSLGIDPSDIQTMG